MDKFNFVNPTVSGHSKGPYKYTNKEKEKLLVEKQERKLKKK